MALRVHEFGPETGRPVVALHGLTAYGGRWREIAGPADLIRRFLTAA